MKKLRPFLALGLAILYYALLPAQTSTHRSCVLPIGPPSEIPISKPFKGLIPEEKMATITVDFLSSGSVFGNTCTTWDVDAQAAFNFAVSIYEPLFTSTQTIQIQACWSNDLPAGTLGSAGAFSFSQLFQGGNSLGFFPRPLVEKLTNSDNGPVDIVAVFNASRSDWYFGTDAVPQPTMLDFVTVVLHEITHGMGFTGNASVDDGTGDAECNGVANTGCYGFSGIPTTFTKRVEDNAGNSIINLVTNPSLALGSYLLGQNGGLYFDGPSFGSPVQLYTPTTFNQGSSYSHLDLATYSPNELMVPSLGYNTAIHQLGLAQNVLNDIGWVNIPLPVELVDFRALTVSRGIELSWETAWELDNRGFYIERSPDGREWERIDFVEGQVNRDELQAYSYLDAAPLPGLNYYRLRQVDFSGAEAVSHIEQATWDGLRAESHLWLSPNPAQEWIVIQQSGGNAFTDYGIYNLSGQLLLTGDWPEDGQVSLSALVPGTYILQARGANSAKQIKLVKQ